MKKSDLISVVMNAASIDTKADATRAVDAMFDAIMKSLSQGEEVAIANFGTFKVTRRKERQGRNPKTGEAITIKAANMPKFRPAKALKEAVN